MAHSSARTEEKQSLRVPVVLATVLLVMVLLYLGRVFFITLISAILLAFLAESLGLALLGGLVGLLLASTMQLFTISTMNWQSFAELAFTFSLDAGIVVKSLLFALLMGLLGGFLPAFRAARMNIVEALRAA